jgi:hypothetical protein
MEHASLSASDAKLFYYLTKEENLDGVFHSTVIGLARKVGMDKKTVQLGLKALVKANVIEIIQKVQGRNAGFIWKFSGTDAGLHNEDYRKEGNSIDLKNRNTYYINSASPNPLFLLAIKQSYANNPYEPIGETLKLISRRFHNAQ